MINICKNIITILLELIYNYLIISTKLNIWLFIILFFIICVIKFVFVFCYFCSNSYCAHHKMRLLGLTSIGFTTYLQSGFRISYFGLFSAQRLSETASISLWFTLFLYSLFSWESFNNLLLLSLPLFIAKY